MRTLVVDDVDSTRLIVDDFFGLMFDIQEIVQIIEDLKSKLSKIIVMPQIFFDQLSYFYRKITNHSDSFLEYDIRRLKAVNSAV